MTFSRYIQIILKTAGCFRTHWMNSFFCICVQVRVFNTLHCTTGCMQYYIERILTQNIIVFGWICYKQIAISTKKSTPMGAIEDEGKHIFKDGNLEISRLPVNDVLVSRWPALAFFSYIYLQCFTSLIFRKIGISL